jgi:hypothetical protein
MSFYLALILFCLLHTILVVSNQTTSLILDLGSNEIEFLDAYFRILDQKNEQATSYTQKLRETVNRRSTPGVIINWESVGLDDTMYFVNSYEQALQWVNSNLANKSIMLTKEEAKEMHKLAWKVSRQRIEDFKTDTLRFLSKGRVCDAWASIVDTLEKIEQGNLGT